MGDRKCETKDKPACTNPSGQGFELTCCRVCQAIGPFEVVDRRLRADPGSLLRHHVDVLLHYGGVLDAVVKLLVKISTGGSSKPGKAGQVPRVDSLA